MNAAQARKDLETLASGQKPGLIWNPLPICERLPMDWKASDFMAAARPVTLRIRSVFSRQRFVNVARVAAFIELLSLGRAGVMDAPKYVALWEGTPILLDGHHRIVAMKLCGIREVQCLATVINGRGEVECGVDAPCEKRDKQA